MSHDPDDKATADAAEALKDLLREKGVTITRPDAKRLAFNTICKWIQSRAFHWAVRRGKAGFGEPDALTLGFCEAALGQIAETATAAALPFDKAIGEWSKPDICRLFVIAHDAIQATTFNTLEDTSQPEELPT